RRAAHHRRVRGLRRVQGARPEHSQGRPDAGRPAQAGAKVSDAGFVRDAAAAYLSLFYASELAYQARALLVGALRPRDEDCDAALAPASAAAARRAYAAVWRGTPTFAPRDDQPRLRVRVHASDDLARAPASWRSLAGALRPGRMWVAWAFVADGGAG